MPKCPNCGQQSSRTKDWACQWCGYPLLLRSYREIPMTYKEWKEKEPREQMTTVSDRIGESPLAEPVAEPEVEMEAVVEAEVEVEPVAEAKAEIEAEPEAEAEVKEGVEAVAEAEPQPEAEVKEEVEAVVEAQVEPEAEVKEEVEAVAEAEVEPKPEMVEEQVEPVAEVKPEPKPRAKRKRAPKGKAKAKSESEAVTEVEPVPEPEPESVPAEMAVTVEELQLAFADDMTEAEGKFVDKVLKITGFVGRIAVNDIIDSPCVVLTSSEKTVLRNVLCVFDKKHAPELKLLVPGQTVTVQGKYDSCTINILVTDCVLVN